MLVAHFFKEGKVLESDFVKEQQGAACLLNATVVFQWQS